MAGASGGKVSLEAAAGTAKKASVKRQVKLARRHVRMGIITLVREKSGAGFSSGSAPEEFKLFEESCKPKWFLQKDRIGRKFYFRKPFRISRHIDDLHTWVDLGYTAGEFGATQTRHNDVGEKNIQFSRVLLCDLERLCGRLGFENLVARSAEDVHQRMPQGRFIVHNQNGSPAVALFDSLDRGGTVNLRNHSLRHREVDREVGAFAGRALHARVATALLDDSVYGGKPQARALAGGLGGEKRLEDLEPGFFVHTLPGIGHFKDNPIPGKSGTTGNVRRQAGSVARGDAQVTSFGHGIAGVDGQIGDHLFDLRRVGENPGLSSVIVKREFDVRSQEPGQHEPGLSQRFVQIQWAEFKHLLAAESEELFGNGRGLFSSALNLVQIGARGGFFREGAVQQFRTSAKDHQHIVEVVSNASGEPSKHLHLLGLAHLRLQDFLFLFEGAAPQVLPVTVVKHTGCLRHRLQIAEFLTRISARAIGNSNQPNYFFSFENRHAEKRTHPWMPGRESSGTWIHLW